MCLTQATNTTSSNMNNASSSSSSSHQPHPRSEPTAHAKEVDSTHHILDVVFDYTGNGDDELTLRRGSKLEVLSKDESISGSRGWWTGRLVNSDSVGIFPANFVANSQADLRIIDYNDLQIGDTIGVGGFGHVYRGKFGDVDVAIKTAKSLASFCSMQTTPSKLTEDDTSAAVQKTLIDGLLREARLFSHLKHRNIIQLFGVSPCLPTRNLYLVMEYACGGALSYLLQQRRSGLYPTVFIQYAKQIAEGINYLHEEACEHIIHRDLKCSNVLILEAVPDAHDDADLLLKTLKITDFGLARKQLQTSSMSAAGTFAWMSPECIRNNEFSTKSDVWSFGVLLWECLTGGLPYQGFDQMQVAFGIATNKYSLPIPSTCPEEFAQLMKDCWKSLPQDRPTFTELLQRINDIIPHDIHPIRPNEESYQSLQEDWRQEIQEMFEELKEKEQEIRDREQAIIQLSLEQNHQRVQLEQWEQQLHEREMHLVECELKLLMGNINQERLHHQTPKVHKRSGRFMRSFLNGAPSLSPTASAFIGKPTNFRHLISVCHNHPTVDHTLSSSSPSTNNILCNSPNKFSNLPHQDSFSSSSTPTTPNMSRLRTLTSSGDLMINCIDHRVSPFPSIVHFPVNTDALNPSTPPEKPPRSSSVTKSPGHRITSRKSKSSSSSSKRKCGKTGGGDGETRWYLDTLSSSNTNNNNNNNNHDTSAVSSTKSTPILDRPTRKLESSDTLSSSSSSCSTPNERSLVRSIFDINSILASIGLGRRVPKSAHSSTTAPPLHQPGAETSPKDKSSSSSTTTTPSPMSKTSRQHVSLSPLTVDAEHSTSSNKTNYRTRPYISPIRPNSLVLSSSPVDSSLGQTNSSSGPDLPRHDLDTDDADRYYSAQSSALSTPMTHVMGLSSHLKPYEPSVTRNIHTEDRTSVLTIYVESKDLSH